MKASKLVVLALGVLIAVAAGAQTPGSRTGSAMPRNLPPPKGDDPSLVPMTVLDQVREQLAQLETDLLLTPGQRPLWQKYSTQVQKLVDDVARTRTAERFPKGTALQQFELLGDTARNRLTAIEEIVDSGTALYATLDVRQKELADRRLARLPLPLLNGNPPAGGPGSTAEWGSAGPGTRPK